ncbi:PqqD family protein [Baekduia soli]|uniref:PqqD family protein n=1 Tax=Baekduia soli TaxID=496014 RepID=A0A5B8U0X6_9ACTN|nr:PqqD family protein [Baekduia soli]QEC46673.1 PqqD family protein [Baekduia soli]
MSDDPSVIRLRSGDVPWREVDGQIVVLDSSTWNYVGLGGSATELWPLIVQGTTLPAMADVLCSAYDVDRARAVTDVQGFVERLVALDLVEQGA